MSGKPRMNDKLQYLMHNNECARKYYHKQFKDSEVYCKGLLSHPISSMLLKQFQLHYKIVHSVISIIYRLFAQIKSNLLFMLVKYFY